MIDMNRIMAAMNAGDASKISPVLARARKKRMLAEALAKKIAAAKKQRVTGAVTKTSQLKKAAASKKVVRKVLDARVKKSAKAR